MKSTATPSDRRGLWILLSVVGVPLAVGLAAYVVLRQVPGADYDRCLNALDSMALSNPGIASLVEDIRRSPSYAASKLNVNRPYVAGTINVLIPNGKVKWPTACPLTSEPADCVTSAKDSYVICNPAIGREVGSTLLLSGAANVETVVALRFLLVTFLGHELGHLQFGTARLRRHLIPSEANASMNCAKRAPGEETEEQRADAYGVKVACESIRRRSDAKALPNSPGDLLGLLSRLEPAPHRGNYHSHADFGKHARGMPPAAASSVWKPTSRSPFASLSC
jgi:hypothetical protein